MQILVETLDQLDRGNATGVCFLFHVYCVTLLSKSEDFYFFHSHTRDRFGRISSEGTSVLLMFCCIKSVVSYIFDINGKLFRSRPYEIQHVYKMWSDLIR